MPKTKEELDAMRKECHSLRMRKIVLADDLNKVQHQYRTACISLAAETCPKNFQTFYFMGKFIDHEKTTEVEVVMGIPVGYDSPAFTSIITDDGRKQLLNVHKVGQESDERVCIQRALSFDFGSGEWFPEIYQAETK